MSDRYSRQILFSPIGVVGQEKIRSGRVAIVGCGALGTVSAEMLVRAGVGSLTLVDRDFVETSNLQRQSLFSEEDAASALPKAVAAAAALQRINREVEIVTQVQDLRPDNIAGLLQGAELILDGTDNFETRFLLNDFAVREKLPWVYGACLGSYGTALAVEPGRSPCLRCLCESPPSPGSLETCDTAGILSPIVHLVASFQVVQCLKILVGESPSREILQVDLWKGEWRSTPSPSAPSPDCPCCVRHQFEFLEGHAAGRLTRLCGRGAVQVYPAGAGSVDLEKISRRLSRRGRVQCNPYLLRAWINGYEIALFPDGRSIIKGTEDAGEARAVYSKYIGN